MNEKAKRVKMFVNYSKFYSFLTLTLSFFLTALAMSTGYSTTEDYKESAMTEVIIDESYNGRQIEVVYNSRVILQLPENPSTGYRWELKPLNDETLKLQGDTYQAPNTITMGAGGTRVFEFIAQSPGTVYLNLHLKKPWDSVSEATEVFEITVQVCNPKPK